MSIIIDPESNELDTLLQCYPFRNEETVLEIGSGDGRMTWTYVDKVAHVTAIEPDADKHAAALADRPAWLKKIEFINQGLDAFANRNKEKFDLAILSWSL